MSSDVIIRARGLGKAYRIYARPSDRLREIVSRGRWAHPRLFWALHNIDLDVRRGETVAIVGRNGSGKSTLLEMISGTLDPTEGEVEVRGRVAALLELGAGFNDQFTGRENVRLNATILGLSSAELAESFDAIVRFADIGDFLDQPVKTYSSGMFARLAFAVAIHTSPDILIVDEILSVGDEAFQRKCFARIEAIKQRGGSILFVSHAASTVVELCDRAVLLDGGRRLLTGSPKTVLALYQKLAYASNEQVDAVREEIAQEARSPGSHEVDGASAETEHESLGGAETELDQPVPGEGSTSEVEEPEEFGYLDPFLESKSVVSYEPNGAEIFEPALLTLAGEPVNCLVSGQRYVFCYRARFDKDAFDVRYHTLVKTVTGLELGGGIHPTTSDAGFDLSAGECVAVRFQFRCMLNPAVYFMNCGITGSGGEQLHRVVDALAFRVLPRGETRTFGHVDFGHRATVSSDA